MHTADIAAATAANMNDRSGGCWVWLNDVVGWHDDCDCWEGRRKLEYAMKGKRGSKVDEQDFVDSDERRRIRSSLLEMRLSKNHRNNRKAIRLTRGFIYGH